jgi:hypothetical protein
VAYVCRRIVNDSLRTDVALLYPPYMIALSAMYMACSMQQKDAKKWFAELNVDMDKVDALTGLAIRGSPIVRICCYQGKNGLVLTEDSPSDDLIFSRIIVLSKQDH